VRRLLAATFVGSLASIGGLGIAWAATIQGTDGADRLRGTRGADAIYGRGGADLLEGLAGPDLLNGGSGRDTLAGGAGADRLSAHADESADGVRCGSGRDVVTAELHDVVAADCEVVSRQLSRDPYDNFEGQHQTQVEPDSFSFGSTIVTAFQSGRFLEGGTTNIGWATSRDGGRTWRSGFLPFLSQFGNPPGPASRVSDPVAAYDDLHRTWMIASLGAVGSESQLLVSRSPNGVEWTRPVVAARDSTEEYDKEWIVCDNWAGSRFRGGCYLVYLDLETGELRARRSRDGGLTWSAWATVRVAPVAEAGRANGAYPVVRPDGTLVVLFAVLGGINEVDSIEAARSRDGGATFERPVLVSELRGEFLLAVRAPPFPSADVDRSGRIYVAWSDCRFRANCLANDIVRATSRDGVAWSAPARIPTGDPTASVDYFVPGLGVDPTSTGIGTRLAVTYHSFRQPEGCLDTCRWGIDIGVIASVDGGVTWSRPQRLNAESMPLHWLADTGLGRMTGDYISTSYVGGRPVPVFSLAAEPVFGEFRQAIFAGTSLALTPP
jgi:hypothetical protein